VAVGDLCSSIFDCAMQFVAVGCCAVLCCAVLCCAVLCCAVLWAKPYVLQLLGGGQADPDGELEES